MILYALGYMVVTSAIAMAVAAVATWGPWAS
jgi:hypothetical protein